MKLNTKQIEQVQTQVGVDPIPEDNPATQNLKDHFGDHTFYLDQNGLHVWEWVDGPESEGQPVTAMRVASWTDEEKKALAPHEPVASGTIVELHPAQEV